jgi:hypothetical protein
LSQRWLRAALALCLGVAGVGIATDPSHPAAAQPAATVEERSPDVTVTVAPAASGVLRPEQDLRVSVVLRNTGTEPLPDGSVRLRIGDRIASSQELGAWLVPREDAVLPAGTVLGTEDVPQLERGASSRPIEFTIPADRLGFLSRSAWGAHPLWAEYAAGDTTAVIGRTSVVWEPSDAPRQAGIAAAVPLTVPSTESGLIDAVDLERYTGPAGVLTRQLEAVEDRAIAVGIDPMILVSIRVLGSEAPQSALDWLARLEALDNETFALAYADTDLAAVSQADGSVPTPQNFDFALDPTRFPAEVPTPTPTTGPQTTAPLATPTPTEDPATAPPAPSPAPSDSPAPGEPAVPTTEELLAWDYTLEGIAWPSDDTVTSADLDTFAESGLSTTILTEGNVNAGVLATQAHSRIGEHRALTADLVMSDLLREAAAARTTEQWESAVASLGAALAVVTTERSGRAPLSLATLDRTRPPAQPRVGQTLAALDRLDWVDTATLTGLLDRPARATRLVDRPADDDRLNTIRTLLRAHAAEGTFATIADDPTDITAPRRLRALGLLSQSWRASPDAWFDRSSEFLTESGELRESVQLVESSQVNLLTDLERLPVSIGNSLDVPVTVFVNVRSQSPELIIRENHLEVLVEPQSTARQFVIPVRSLANGTADIVISLVSRTGEPIGEPTRLTVNVQAGWGAAGAVVIGVLVVGLFAVGLFRTFGRNRKRRASEAADD